jgi:hypothetical protein
MEEEELENYINSVDYVTIFGTEFPCGASYDDYVAHQLSFGIEYDVEPNYELMYYDYSELCYANEIEYVPPTTTLEIEMLGLWTEAKKTVKASPIKSLAIIGIVYMILKRVFK